MAVLPSNTHNIYQQYENPQELNYICSVDNLPSIFEHGLLSHKRVQNLNNNVSDPSNHGVQARRADVIPPNEQRDELGKNELKLHQYVNFYLQPYNRCLYDFVHTLGINKICILRVHAGVNKSVEV